MRKVLTGATPFASLDYSCKNIVNKVFGGKIPAARLIAAGICYIAFYLATGVGSDSVKESLSGKSVRRG